MLIRLKKKHGLNAWLLDRGNIMSEHFNDKEFFSFVKHFTSAESLIEPLAKKSIQLNPLNIISCYFDNNMSDFLFSSAEETKEIKKDLLETLNEIANFEQDEFNTLFDLQNNRAQAEWYLWNIPRACSLVVAYSLREKFETENIPYKDFINSLRMYFDHYFSVLDYGEYSLFQDCGVCFSSHLSIPSSFGVEIDNELSSYHSVLVKISDKFNVRYLDVFREMMIGLLVQRNRSIDFHSEHFVEQYNKRLKIASLKSPNITNNSIVQAYMKIHGIGSIEKIHDLDDFMQWYHAQEKSRYFYFTSEKSGASHQHISCGIQIKGPGNEAIYEICSFSLCGKKTAYIGDPLLEKSIHNKASLVSAFEQKSGGAEAETLCPHCAEWFSENKIALRTYLHHRLSFDFIETIKDKINDMSDEEKGFKKTLISEITKDIKRLEGVILLQAQLSLLEYSAEDHIIRGIENELLKKTKYLD